VACEARTMDHLTRRSTNSEHEGSWIVTTANAPKKGSDMCSQDSKPFIQIRDNGWRVKMTDQPHSDSANAGPPCSGVTPCQRCGGFQLISGCFFCSDEMLRLS